MSDNLPALARPALPASPTPTLDASPYRWLTVEAPDRHSRLPTVNEETALRRELVAANAPIALDDLERAVARLVASYPQRGPADVRGYVLAVAEHLGEYPVDVVEATCREIVRNCKFLPTVAELVEIAEPRVERRRFALRAVQMITAERERRRQAEEEERERREANARYTAASERARLRLAAALPGPERNLDLAWHRLSPTRRLALTAAALASAAALAAAVAELVADPAEIDDSPEVPF